MPANMQFNYTVNPQKGFNPITKKEENKTPHVTKMELFQSFLPSFFAFLFIYSVSI